MNSSLVLISIPPVLLLLAMAILSRIGNRGVVARELKRKALHISVLQRHFGTVLHDIRRESFGEIYFAISIAGLLLLTQSKPLFFVIPILILALADASAAIVGKVFPVGPLAGIARGKTTAGCATFFVVAFIVSFWSLEYFTDLPIAHALMVATGRACRGLSDSAFFKHSR
jgi:dolichol kinase